MKDEKRVVSATVRQQPSTSPDTRQISIDAEYQPPDEFYDIFSVSNFGKKYFLKLVYKFLFCRR